MLIKDVKVGEIYFQKRYKNSQSEALLVLSTNKQLSTHEGWSSEVVLSRHDAGDPRNGRYIGLRINAELKNELDTWAEDGTVPSILSRIPDIVRQMDELIAEKLPTTRTSVHVKRGLFGPGTTLTAFAPRQLVGPWVRERRAEFAEYREMEREAVARRKAAQQREETFGELEKLAKLNGAQVAEARDYYSDGHLSYEYAKIKTTDLMALLKEIEAARGNDSI